MTTTGSREGTTALPAEATVPQMEWTFESQAVQFPKVGQPGIRYQRNTVPVARVTHRRTGRIITVPSEAPVDVLVYRNRKGHVIGILYHYPHDILPWERAGNINVVVRADRRRRGIGSQLLAEAARRWPIRWEQQDYTPDGLALARTVSRRENGFEA